MGCAPSSPDDDRNKKIEDQLSEDKKKYMAETKILLLGPGESGKSTVFKQMKIIQLHGGYTKEELMEFKYIVYGNCITQMKCILEAATKLRMSVSNPSNQVRFNRMLDMPNGGDSWSTEVAMDIKHLWLDQGVRDVYALKDKHYQLNDSANYFFESVDRIMQDNYMPIVDDVLRARVRTTGIQEAEFKFDDLSLRMLDVGGQRSERRKWIHCFDSVTAVLFLRFLERI